MPLRGNDAENQMAGTKMLAEANQRLRQQRDTLNGVVNAVGTAAQGTVEQQQLQLNEAIGHVVRQMQKRVGADAKQLSRPTQAMLDTVNGALEYQSGSIQDGVLQSGSSQGTSTDKTTAAGPGQLSASSGNAVPAALQPRGTLISPPVVEPTPTPPPVISQPAPVYATGPASYPPGTSQQQECAGTADSHYVGNDSYHVWLDRTANVCAITQGICWSEVPGDPFYAPEPSAAGSWELLGTYDYNGALSVCSGNTVLPTPILPPPPPVSGNGGNGSNPPVAPSPPVTTGPPGGTEPQPDCQCIRLPDDQFQQLLSVLGRRSYSPAVDASLGLIPDLLPASETGFGEALTDVANASSPADVYRTAFALAAAAVGIPLSSQPG